MKQTMMKRNPNTAETLIHDVFFRRQETTHALNRKRVQSVRSYIQLFKIRIALFASLSAATGGMLADPSASTAAFISAAGVFLLACGAGALNQFQERANDALMPRTQARPLPSGRIQPVHALYAAALLLTAGLLVLSLADTPVIGLGVLAVLWYNLVYTGLKKITAFAAVPGALTGALPPVIGWAAAGGSLSDIRLAAVCFFFFMWQVPHFWLLLLSHAEDFRKARTPSLNKLLAHEQLTRITAAWIFAAAVSSLFIPFYGAVSGTVSIVLAPGAGWLAWRGATLCRQKERKSIYAETFRSINIFIVAVMLLLNAGSFLL